MTDENPRGRGRVEPAQLACLLKSAVLNAPPHGLEARLLRRLGEPNTLDSPSTPAESQEAESTDGDLVESARYGWVRLAAEPNAPSLLQRWRPSRSPLAPVGKRRPWASW